MPNKTKPGITDCNVIQPEDVRHFIMDRQTDDNALHLDLYFDEEEILKAMRYTAMEYNSIPPYVHDISPTNVPNHMAFLYGIIYHLYLSKLQKLGRNDITYDAGGVSTSLNKDQIKFLQEMMPFYKQEFINYSKQFKQITNLENSFGSF